MRPFLFIAVVLSVSLQGLSQTYTFNGNGNWSLATNWSNNTIPPDTLPAGDTIYISPLPGDSCVLNVVQQYISEAATLIVSSGANFIIHGELNIHTYFPFVVTSAIRVYDIDGCTVLAGGNVISDEGRVVTARGLVWSTNHNPTIELDSKTINGTGLGAFSSYIVSLLTSTTYYLRAYATNSTGTAYGDETSFTTLQPQYFVNTSTVTSITNNSAQCGAVIDNTDALCPNSILTVGLVWDIHPAPTVSLSTKTVEAGGVLNYTSDMTGLASNTIYYVRPYIYVHGPAAPILYYGGEIFFTTH